MWLPIINTENNLVISVSNKLAWESHFLLYKMRGEESADQPLQEEDFMIVVQSPVQKRMLQQFGWKGVCIDSTHRTTGYDFNLMNLAPDFQWYGACQIMKIPLSWQCFLIWLLEIVVELKQTGFVTLPTSTTMLGGSDGAPSHGCARGM